LDSSLDITSVRLSNLALERDGLNATFVEHVPFAYQLYKDAEEIIEEAQDESASQEVAKGAWERVGALGTTNLAFPAGKTDPEAFKSTFCISVKIDFVGVWYGSSAKINPQ
jgi:hypothetical protein